MVAEAMASGVPCVVTDVGASAELVADDTGTLVPVGSTSALAEALGQFIALPRAERSDLGLQARERVLQDFGLQRTVAAYRDLYASLLG